jgi:integrase
MPRRTRKSGKLAKARPVTLEEFERIVLKVETVRPHDYPQWQRLLWGYWHSGFRLRELLALSWDSTADVAIDTRYKFPLVRFSAAGHKRGEDQYQVITPEFWELIKDRPQTGPVFPVVRQQRQGKRKRKLAGKPYDADWIGTVIRQCGAGVKTGLFSDKTASSHDLGKRAWTTRWSGELSQADLANLARHKSTATTQDYYVLPALEELAAKVGWGKEE